MRSRHIIRSFTSVVLVLSGLFTMASAGSATAPSLRPLTMQDRLAGQRAIEEVYWRHRSWPQANPGTKPSLAEVLPEEILRARAEDGPRMSAALDHFFRRSVTGAMVQAEIDRMFRETRSPGVLKELVDSLGGDPVRFAEIVARPVLARRLLRGLYASDPTLQADVRGEAEAGRPFEEWWAEVRSSQSTATPSDNFAYRLPRITAAPKQDDTWQAIARPDPDPQWNATAVWTGTEMIQWGGTSGYKILNTGVRYDPLTDTWSTTSVTADTPAPRTNHVAVWTGSEMIVWGGQDASGQAMNTGGRYDPATDSWTPTRLDATTPAARTASAAVWTGSGMLVWGGQSVAGGTQNLSSGARYDPVTDTWAPTRDDATTPQARHHHTMVWTGTEAFIWGGDVNNICFSVDTGIKSGGRYNPQSDTWTAIPDPPPTIFGRSGHSAIWTGTEMIVWGGEGLSLPLCRRQTFKTGARYNPATNSWTETRSDATAPAARISHTSIWTGSRMVIWGGNFGQSDPAAGQPSLYDPSTDTWSEIPSNLFVKMGNARSAVWTGSEMIAWPAVVNSGYNNAGARFNPATNLWTATSIPTAVPPSSAVHAAVWTGAEMIVRGGSQQTPGGRYNPALNTWEPTVNGPSGPLGAVWTGSEMILWNGGVDRYNPTTDTATNGSSTGAPAAGGAVVWTGTEMVVWGGIPDILSFTNTGGRYNPATDTWTTMLADGSAPSPRQRTSLVWTGSEVIVWGGVDNSSQYLNTGGRYNPSTDSWLPTTVSGTTPAGRQTHTAVWTGSEMIVWGGSNANVLGTGGRYDPAHDTWAAVNATGAPIPRNYHRAVWTGEEMIVWGGHDDLPTDGVAQTGGRYRPGTDSWMPTSVSGDVPDARSQHDQLWTGDGMLVFGGGSLYGSIYTACAAPLILYQDADGDGTGAGTALNACGTAPGYVSTGGDCNDADAAVWSTPGEVNGVQFDSQVQLSWQVPTSAGGLADRYDVLRSTSPSNFTGAAACLATDIPDSFAVDADVPSPGAFYSYLVRAKNACPGGSGSLGTDSQSNPRNGRSCP